MVAAAAAAAVFPSVAVVVVVIVVVVSGLRLFVEPGVEPGLAPGTPHGYPTPLKYISNASNHTYTVCSGSEGTGMPHVSRVRGREIDMSARRSSVFSFRGEVEDPLVGS